MKHIGYKITVCGKVATALGIIISVVAWIALLNTYNPVNWTMAWVALVVGPLLSLLYGWLLQGFGIIVTKAEVTMPKPSSADPLPKPVLKTGDDII